jgi:hypothetical protein
MSERCRAFQDLLVAETLHMLNAPERESLAQHLRECIHCTTLRSLLIEDDRRLTAFVGSTTPLITELESRIGERVPTERIPASHRRWTDRFLPPPRLRLAAVAVLAAVLTLGVIILDHDQGGSLVWAEVLTRVEEAESYICRRIEKRSGEPVQEIVEYRSAAHGLRQDIYQDGKLQAVQYIIPSERMLYALVHRDRTYMRQHLSDEQIAELRRQSNASEIVKSFREHEFHSLGSRRVDGRMAEGIEIRDPTEWKALFESGTWSLWVDVETQWPIRIELEGNARGGSVHKKYTLKDFEWNAHLSARDFRVEIPPGYELIADLEQVVANEEESIAGLRAFARLLDGRYPSTLSFATVLAEAEEYLDDRHDRYDSAAGKDLESLFAMRSACNFYRDMLSSDRDVAYYGDEVTSRDFDHILLRWRLEDGSYRVIYGDLRAETLSPARLEEIEARHR